ncbi:CRISPR-associated protein, Cmr1 family [Leptolyngbyaceae cyanobacterium JSC-12]|nr:CRISPR-associated protein, Cmr1 family [Leptolyngbyaceae cyanobacterium JSC-12]
MPSITFDLETVTPLFLSGADQTTAELRPPAFRGALRYWFRAIAGANYWNDINTLKSLESSILGDSGDHGGSKITIRLINCPTPEELDPQSVWMTQDRARERDGSGIGYLLFSMGMQERKAIGVQKPVKFSIKFSTRPNPATLSQDIKNLLIVANLFCLAVNLGGFGSRERRGAGSLRILKVTSDIQDFSQDMQREEIPLTSIRYVRQVNDFAKSFKNQILKAQAKTSENLGFNLKSLSRFDQKELPDLEIFRKATASIYLLKDAFESWKEALDYIGKEYANYRSRIALKERSVFGLPMKSIDMDARRPSPLRIKIIRPSNDDYYCLLIRMKAKFPSDARVQVGDSQFELIDSFIASFRDDIIQVI